MFFGYIGISFFFNLIFLYPLITSIVIMGPMSFAAVSFDNECKSFAVVSFDIICPMSFSAVSSDN